MCGCVCVCACVCVCVCVRLVLFLLVFAFTVIFPSPVRSLVIRLRFRQEFIRIVMCDYAGIAKLLLKVLASKLGQDGLAEDPVVVRMAGVETRCWSAIVEQWQSNLCATLDCEEGRRRQLGTVCCSM